MELTPPESTASEQSKRKFDDKRKKESAAAVSARNASVNIDEYSISYPPLANPSKRSDAAMNNEVFLLKMSKNQMHTVEWICSNTGSVMFIVGSYYFLPYPKFDEFKVLAAILFIVASILFFIGAVMLYYRSDSYLWEDYGLSFNCCMYIVANTLFILGSIFFYPAISADKSCELIGISLFIIGSFVFVFSPLYDMYRVRLLMKESAALRLAVQDARDGQSEELRESMANVLRNDASMYTPPVVPVFVLETERPDVMEGGNHKNIGGVTAAGKGDGDGGIGNEKEKKRPLAEMSTSEIISEAERMMNAETYWAQLSVGLFYILGSLLFVVGSILFLPQFYSRDSVPAVCMFIAGSAIFLAATLVTTLITVYANFMMAVGACTAVDVTWNEVEEQQEHAQTQIQRNEGGAIANPMAPMAPAAP